MPRTVCSNLLGKGSSSLARRRRAATSTTLVSGQFMSHTCSASVVRDSTWPRQHNNSVSSVNSLAGEVQPRAGAVRLRLAGRGRGSAGAAAWRQPRRCRRRQPRQRAPRASSSEKAKGDEVVVGAFLQAACRRSSTCRARSSISTGVWPPALAHRLEHAEAVDAGRHQVEQHQGLLALAGEQAALDAVARHVDDVAVLRQALIG